MENQINIVESALEAATKPFAFEINGQTMIANNHGDRGWSVEHADQKLQKEPMRPRGTYTLHDCASFISYVGNHRQEGTQIIINADFARGRINTTAQLDGHVGTSAGWESWKAEFSPTKTPAANAWVTHDKTKLSQSDMASFFEDHAIDIVSEDPSNPQIFYPTSAAVLDFARNLEINKSLKFKRSVREQDGTQSFEFCDENDGNTATRLKAFEKFGIQFQPHLNGPAYFVEAFLKFRMDNNNGRIDFWYELRGLDKVYENACKEIAATIETALGESIPVYYGSF